MKLALMLGLACGASVAGAGCGGGSAAGGQSGAGGDPGAAQIVEPSEGEGGGTGRAPDGPQAASPPPRGDAAPEPAKPPVVRGPRGENATILAAHNRVRALHCARPLVWSEALAATAQEWANSLRDSGCRFEHSQTAYGENLAAGTRLSGENAVELWYDEVQKYDFKKHGFSARTGHFTQVVWAGSRSLGCGSVECQGMRMWVCHYDPAGNVMTMFPDNVSPASCK